MDITRYTNNLKQFRTTLYQNINKRADSVVELIDAMCSTPNAQSVVEYTEAECYRRSYTTLYKAVNAFKLDALWLPRQLNRSLPRPKAWPFWLLMVDVTPNPRPYAQTLEDRSMVYQPEVVKGKLPVTIGHQYSTVALGLEAEVGVSSSWVLPMLTERVASEKDKEQVGVEQIKLLLKDETLPFAQALTVVVEDSSYSKPACLYAQSQLPNLVTIARSRGTRTYYHQPVPCAERAQQSSPGHPTWYGQRFALSAPQTWSKADDCLTLWASSRRGKQYRIEIQVWHNLLMPGTHQPQPMPMHQYPFSLVRIMRYDKDGNPACKNALWLIVMGERRHELTLAQIYQAYSSRFDIEHFFRFGKQKLLLVDFQTPKVACEENWFQLVHIAYAQLWMARHVVNALPRPWERNLSAMRQSQISPTLVQRDFARIIRQFGTPALPPKLRGISPGRRKNTLLPKRLRQKVVVKGNKVA